MLVVSSGAAHPASSPFCHCKGGSHLFSFSMPWSRVLHSGPGSWETACAATTVCVCVCCGGYMLQACENYATDIYYNSPYQFYWSDKSGNQYQNSGFHTHKTEQLLWFFFKSNLTCHSNVFVGLAKNPVTIWWVLSGKACFLMVYTAPHMARKVTGCHESLRIWLMLLLLWVLVKHNFKTLSLHINHENRIWIRAARCLLGANLSLGDESCMKQICFHLTMVGEATKDLTVLILT